MCLKGQFTPKSKVHIFPLTLSVIYQSTLFWCELPSFGDIGRGALCLLPNTMAVNGAVTTTTRAPFSPIIFGRRRQKSPKLGNTHQNNLDWQIALNVRGKICIFNFGWTVPWICNHCVDKLLLCAHIGLVIAKKLCIYNGLNMIIKMITRFFCWCFSATTPALDWNT